MSKPVERVIDGICARAEKGELALTQEEFDALQEVVMAWERGMVPREQYDAMMAARDHCKRQTNEAHALIQDLRHEIIGYHERLEQA